MARSKDNHDSRLTKDELDEIEEAIELLKVAYERYFNGVDRVPPSRRHDKLKRRVRQLVKYRGSTTALRFRANTLKSRLISYEQYWHRVLHQIEKGTHIRVIAEAGRRDREIARQLAQSEPPGDTEPAPMARATRSAGAGRMALPDGFEAKQARVLYKQLVAAKKAAGESTTGLTYGKLVQKLAREVPKLRAKHGGRIRFEVATSGGKVRLRARRSSKKAS